MSKTGKNPKQPSIFDTVKPEEHEPATDLMKIVATKAGDLQKMKKTFTPEELKEIMLKRANKQDLSKEETAATRIATRTVKKWVKAQSAGDYSKIYLYPSYTADTGVVWYKMMDFSALYFSYYLAPRMGRTANIYIDRDSYAKAKYIASTSCIEEVAEDFLKLGGKKVEVTLTGVYVFTLAEPQTADDFSRLMLAEEQRRDKVRNMMRPAKMAPVTFKLMVDFINQVAPKIKHLEKRDFFTVGEDLMQELRNTLETYYTYSDGHLSTTEAGEELLVHLNKIKAGLIILQEMDAWDGIETAAMLGESLMFFREQVVKDFKLKVGKESAES